MINTIKQYNEIVWEIVNKFAIRYYKEMFNETCTKEDYHLMNYAGINCWPIEICDMYLSLDDILMSELYQIRCQTITERYNEKLDDTTKLNLYNSFRFKTDPWLYHKQEEEDIKRCEENIKYSQEQLETLINNNKI